MIELQNVSKRIDGIEAIQNISFRVEQGEVLGITGSNGAGKTQLARILAGVSLPSGGVVSYYGKNLKTSFGEIRNTIGFFPEEEGVYPNTTVLNYLNFYSGAYRLPYTSRTENITNLLELVGLKERERRIASSLSRGEKQRLNIARCLISDPKCLIIDGAEYGLDPTGKRELSEIVRQVASMGKTVIYASGEPSFLWEFCDTIALLDRGSLVAKGGFNDLLRFMSKERIIEITPLELSVGLINALREWPGVGRIYENAESVEMGFEGGRQELAALVGQLIAKGYPVCGVRESSNNLNSILENRGEERG